MLPHPAQRPPRPATGLLPASLWSALGAAALAAGCTPQGPGVRTGAVEVEILAQDTSWSARVSAAREDGGSARVEAEREVHVPLGAEVTLGLASRDYICLFALPELGVRDFAAPGLPARFVFRASKAGRFALRGDELCGLPHGEKTRGLLVVEAPAAFQAWVRSRERE